MERLTLDDLAAATGGRLPCAIRRATFTGVSLDSRTLEPGQVFWAVRGPRHDGHAHAAEALRRGAVAVVADQALPTSIGPALRVEDTIAALGRFAGWYRRLQDAVVVGVTGSVGKTTTRELLFAALGGSDTAVRSARNFNNQFGVPLTLLSIEQRHQFAVVEMGASRSGEIGALATAARPEVGVITHLGVAHLADFGSEAAIAHAKAELLDAVPAAGFAVLPGDCPKAQHIAARCRGSVTFVGTGPQNQVVLADVVPVAGRLKFTVNGAPFQIGGRGRHLAANAAMAVAVARRLGRSDAAIAAGLATFGPLAGRGRVAVQVPWTVVDDTYNANPDSMRAALDTVAGWPTVGRRIFVCGDMYGLGDATAAAHLALGADAGARNLDLLVCIGEHAGRVAQGARRVGMDARRLSCFSTRDAATAWLCETLRPGDVLLAKASRPLELERLVQVLVSAAEQGLAPRRAA